MGHTYTKNIQRQIFKNLPKRSRHSKLKFSGANKTDQKVVSHDLNLIWPPFSGTSALIPTTTKSDIRKGSYVRCLHFSGSFL